MPAEAVIFDIGNVLIEWDPSRLYRPLIAEPERLRWFLETVVPLSWHTEHDRGRPFAETIPERQALFPDYSDLIALFRDRWEDMIGPPITGSVAILEALAARNVPVFALTNYSAETFPAFLRRFAFSRHFRDVVVSGEEGMVKPDPRIYALAIERFGVAPSRTLFIDDREDNVIAARKAGLIGLLFTDPEALRRDMAAQGIRL